MQAGSRRLMMLRSACVPGPASGTGSTMPVRWGDRTNPDVVWARERASLARGDRSGDVDGASEHVLGSRGSSSDACASSESRFHDHTFQIRVQDRASPLLFSTMPVSLHAFEDEDSGRQCHGSLEPGDAADVPGSENGTRAISPETRHGDRYMSLVGQGIRSSRSKDSFVSAVTTLGGCANTGQDRMRPATSGLACLDRAAETCTTPIIQSSPSRAIG